MIKSAFKKRPVLWTVIAIAVVHLLICFTVIRFGDTRIPVFSFERIVAGDGYMARVLGSHVLETEHGQIRLGHFSRILVAGGAIGIEAENFKLYRGALVATIGGVVAVGGVVVVARRKKL